MFEIAKLCNEYEKLGTVEKGLILTKKSVSVLAKVSALNVPEIDPVETLASFVLGSIVCDGRINEKEYLLMYPALVKVFGTEFDFDSIKTAFESDKESTRLIKKYTQDLLTILADADESLQEDLIMVCLGIVALDGKISLKERTYIRKLCKA